MESLVDSNGVSKSDWWLRCEMWCDQVGQLREIDLFTVEDLYVQL